MKVPHEPEPPLGAPGSAKVFRAGQNHYRLKVLHWAVGQFAAVVGIGASLVMLGAFEQGIEEARRAAARPSPSPSAVVVTGDGEGAPTPSTAGARSRAERERDREQAMGRLAALMPGYMIPAIKVLEVAGLAFLGAQMLLTFAVVRLEFEQHWYIVTDRSLRIRTGVLRLQESTMSFANIQQVEVQQGPLQRLLGLGNVCVRSAGGGGDDGAGAHGHGHEPSLHLGVFAGVSNAIEIRDLILERLRRFRESGLGDPEDRRSPLSAEARPSSATMMDAIAELQTEVRLLSRELLLHSDRG